MADTLLRPPGVTRLTAVLAAVAVAAGAVVMTVGLVAAPGPWTRGYVSEAGTAGMPLASAYQGGLLVLALGVLLLAAGVRSHSRVASLLLVVAGLLAGTSGAVPCTRGCPLPPYEPTSVADLVHTGASIVGMAALAFAMVGVAVTAGIPRPVRRLAGSGAGLIFPLAVIEALGMLLIGRSALTSTVERLMLAIAIVWLTVTALGLTYLRNSVTMER